MAQNQKHHLVIQCHIYNFQNIEHNLNTCTLDQWQMNGLTTVCDLKFFFVGWSFHQFKSSIQKKSINSQIILPKTNIEPEK